VSKLARIELEDAKTELKRAQEAAAGMGRGAEGEEADDVDEGEEEKAAVDGDGNDEDAWVE
jgi:periodic tryptophan protein 1